MMFKPKITFEKKDAGYVAMIGKIIIGQISWDACRPKSVTHDRHYQIYLALPQCVRPKDHYDLEGAKAILIMKIEMWFKHIFLASIKQDGNDS